MPTIKGPLRGDTPPLFDLFIRYYRTSTPGSDLIMADRTEITSPYGVKKKGQLD